jgi:hypothetical protein
MFVFFNWRIVGGEGWMGDGEIGNGKKDEANSSIEC